ncbi:MAG TPA: spermidine/putrescine ABC transporter ATP-binding protein PotA [Coxiellaceae bacterium]|nr:MAG: putrescine/spermidine ABC transporter ATP-binding protein [Gammaproteobacteria bacterium RBG_16_37_9]HBY55908.1 spermidine/putrescine ABC transporter ATP-binding protein PotA [Coxiellaceae bacterium]
MHRNIIELVGVSKKFGDYQALQETSITIQHGEFITLLGPSGCGKTTMLRLISGFDKPDTGKIFIDGRDVTDLPPEKRHLNMVFQSYALFPHMTVYENVAFGLRCKKIVESEIQRRVTDVLRMVKLEQLAERKPNQLSGGQQQRVAIARAVVNEPIVLLLDEPLSALDYNLRKNMQIELKQLQRRLGITFIFVTHDQEEALSMSDRVAIMNEGYIEQLGTPKNVYEEPENLYVADFIGEANIFNTEILEVYDNKLVVEIEGKRLALNNKKDLVAKQKVHIIIRPEDITVWGENEITAEESKNMLPGIVEQVIYKGSTVDLIVRLPSEKKILAAEFFNEDDEKLDYHSTEKVWIDWIPGWEVILPHEEKI